MGSTPGLRNWTTGLAGAALAAAVLSACSHENAAGILQIYGTTMGTDYTVKIVNAPAAMSRDSVQAGVAAILEVVNDRMSTYRSDSELSRLNANTSTDWIDVSPELLEVIETARGVSEMSAGAFDVTVGPLVNLWGFGAVGGTRIAPTRRDIVDTLARIGYEKISVRRSPPGIRKTREDIYIDLSSIAKGYAVDRIADHLEDRGAQSFLVDIGGELRVKGRNPQGKSWTIAIDKPTTTGRAVQRIIHVTDQAIATSGDYRNFFEHGGKRYSHTIDPTTGMPVAHRLASVTVLSPRAMLADALATALMVLGPDDGYALAQRLGWKAYFIIHDEDGLSEETTSEFDRHLSRIAHPAALDATTAVIRSVSTRRGGKQRAPAFAPPLAPIDPSPKAPDPPSTLAAQRGLAPGRYATPPAPFTVVGHPRSEIRAGDRTGNDTWRSF